VLSPVAELLRALDEGLASLGVRWYLFGAQAVLLYGGARLTADVDVTVALGERPTSELVSALQRLGFALRVADVDRFVERTRVLPLVHEPTGLPLDVVLSGPGPEELFLSRAHPHDIEGVLVPVAAPEDLVVMKILAGRAKDIDDARAIVAAGGSALDHALVRETLGMLEDALDQRDLLPVFEALVRRP
jgi:hypothetical protein